MRSILQLHSAIDDMLADVPATARMRASADILTVLLRMERETNRAITDAQAAKLLPDGPSVVVQMQGCHRSTAYRRASRAKEVARLQHIATNVP